VTLSEHDMDLVNRGLDDDLDAAEKEKLELLIKENPEAESLHRLLTEMSSLLKSIPDTDPAPGLPVRIGNIIESGAAVGEKGRINSIIQRFRRNSKMVPQVRKSGNLGKYIAVAGVTVVLVVVIVVGSNYYGSLKNGSVSGTIGPVDKYSSVQMTDKDIKLKNALLENKEALQSFLKDLQTLKKFAVAVNHDLGLWENDINTAETALQVKKLKGGFTMKDKSEEYGAYADFITNNVAVLDRMIDMLTKIASADTAGKGFEIEKTFNEFENFRLRFSEQFQQVMKSVPDIHNALVKNGLACGLLSHPGGQLGCGMLGSDVNVACKPLGQNEMIKSGQLYAMFFCGGGSGSGQLGYQYGSENLIGTVALGSGQYNIFSVNLGSNNLSSYMYAGTSFGNGTINNIVGQLGTL
jgi:hypothetical protein